MTTARSDAARDDGFTLVELLLATIISAIIMGPLAAAVVVGLRTTDDTSTRLRESHDAQLLADYLVPDVQSAAQVSPSLTSDVCSNDGTGGVLRLRWSDPTSTSSTVPIVVSYVVRTVGTERQLHRLLCSGTTTTLVSDVTVAHELAASGPTVSCATTAGVAVSPCPATPGLVTVTTTAVSGYSYSVTGSRRTT